MADEETILEEDQEEQYEDDLIDTLIDACLSAGIGEIYIVRGYLAEQFDQLLYKYPTVRFRRSPS